MNLPKNGRIVIIDNQVNEAIPLAKVLSINGLSTSFFTGETEQLPNEPIPEIRVMFIDLILTSGTIQTNLIMSQVKSVLNKILGKENGPFIPIAWTKREDLISELETYFRGRGFLFPVVSLEKNECKDSTGEYDLSVIQSKLQNVLQERESLEVFLLWENLVHAASGKTVSQIAKLRPFDGEWNKKITTAIWKMAKGYAGRQLNTSDPTEIIKNALYSFNGIFSDKVNFEITNDSHASLISLPFTSIDRNDPELAADINSKLIIVKDSVYANIPGNVYKNIGNHKINPKEIFKDTRSKKYANFRNGLRTIKQVALEISPVCDYAQDKWKLNRMVPGVLWPYDLSENIKSSAYLYTTPLIRFKNNIYLIVFDFRYLSSIPFGELKEENYFFRIKQELLTDIQSKLAAQVNRPGTVSVE